MNKTLVVFITLILSFPQFIHARPMEGLYLELGAAASSVDMKYDVNDSPAGIEDLSNTTTYPRLSLNWNINLNRHFYVHTGITYSTYQIQRQVRRTIPADNPQGYIELGRNTLINSAYYVTAYSTIGARLAQRPFAPSILLGPKADILVHKDIEWPQTYYENLRPVNVGLIGGLSANLGRLLPWNVSVDAVYEANILPAYDWQSDLMEGSIWHSTLSFAFGVRF